MSLCPNCGSKVKYDIASRQLKCDACSSQFDVYEYDRQQNEGNPEKYQVNAFTCPQCGGELLTTDNDITGNCCYCGANVIFESKMVNEKRPAYIVPFVKTKEDCKQIYQNELKKKKFASKLLKDASYIDGFRGIYMPYWMYDITQDGKFSMKAVHSYVRGDYDIDDIYTINATCDCRYQQIDHDSSSVFSDDISERIEPFDMSGNNMMPFTPSYFSGFYAETTDVDPHIYDNYAVSVANDMMIDYIQSIPDFKKYNIEYPTNQSASFNTRIRGVNIAALPVWFLSYKNNDRVAYAAINGQSGRMISDIPIQVSSVIKASAIAAIVIFLLLGFVQFNPAMVTIIAVMVSGLVIKCCHDDVREIIDKDNPVQAGKKRASKKNNATVTFWEFIAIFICIVIFKFAVWVEPDLYFIDDPFIYGIVGGIAVIFHFIRYGRINADLKKIPNSGYTKFPYPVLCIIASVIGVLVLFINPVSDMIYYGSVVVMIAMELFSFIGILNNYNVVATRPIPQFNIHRGGDDHVF